MHQTLTVRQSFPSFRRRPQTAVLVSHACRHPGFNRTTFRLPHCWAPLSQCSRWFCSAGFPARALGLRARQFGPRACIRNRDADPDRASAPDPKTSRDRPWRLFPCDRGRAAARRARRDAAARNRARCVIRRSFERCAGGPGCNRLLRRPRPTRTFAAEAQCDSADQYPGGCRQHSYHRRADGGDRSRVPATQSEFPDAGGLQFALSTYFLGVYSAVTVKRRALPSNVSGGESGTVRLRARLAGEKGWALAIWEPRSDWRGYNWVKLDVANLTDVPLRIDLRIRDEHPHRDRRNGDIGTIEVAPRSRETVTLGLPQAPTAAKETPIDLAAVQGVVLKRRSANQAREFYLVRIWLE